MAMAAPAAALPVQPPKPVPRPETPGPCTHLPPCRPLPASPSPGAACSAGDSVTPKSGAGAGSGGAPPSTCATSSSASCVSLADSTDVRGMACTGPTAWYTAPSHSQGVRRRSEQRPSISLMLQRALGAGVDRVWVVPRPCAWPPCTAWRSSRPGRQPRAACRGMPGVGCSRHAHQSCQAALGSPCCVAAPHRLCSRSSSSGSWPGTALMGGT